MLALGLEQLWNGTAGAPWASLSIPIWLLKYAEFTSAELLNGGTRLQRPERERKRERLYIIYMGFYSLGVSHLMLMQIQGVRN